MENKTDSIIINDRVVKIDPKIESAFIYHAPKNDQQKRYVELREKAKEFAYLIESCCPLSREKSLALTNLENSVMWANASIARNE